MSQLLHSHKAADAERIERAASDGETAELLRSLRRQLDSSEAERARLHELLLAFVRFHSTLTLETPTTSHRGTTTLTVSAVQANGHGSTRGLSAAEGCRSDSPMMRKTLGMDDALESSSSRILAGYRCGTSRSPVRPSPSRRVSESLVLLRRRVIHPPAIVSGFTTPTTPQPHDRCVQVRSPARSPSPDPATHTLSEGTPPPPAAPPIKIAVLPGGNTTLLQADG
jgi:hypothetical protein